MDLIESKDKTPNIREDNRRIEYTPKSINNKMSTEKIYIILIIIKQKINHFSDAQNKVHHIINTLLEEA